MGAMPKVVESTLRILTHSLYQWTNLIPILNETFDPIKTYASKNSRC